MKKLFLFFILSSFLTLGSNSLKAQGVGWMTFDPATFGESLISAFRDGEQLMAYYQELQAFYDQIERGGGNAQAVLNAVTNHVGVVNNFTNRIKNWKNSWDNEQYISSLIEVGNEMEILNDWKGSYTLDQVLFSDKKLYAGGIPGLSSSIYRDLKYNLTKLNLKKSEDSAKEMNERAEEAEKLFIDSADERAPEIAAVTTNALLVESLKNDATRQQNEDSDRTLAAAAEQAREAEKATVGSFYKSRLGRWSR